MPGHLRAPRIVIAAAATLLVVCGLLFLKNLYVVPVLMYHSVDESWYEPLNNVRPVNFAYQMEFLKRHKYNVISVPEFVAGLKAGKKFSYKTVVLTFDDGNKNNYTHAWPVLKKMDFPATIFVPSAQVGMPDRVTWEQLKEMHATGVITGSHMHTEAYAPDISTGVLWDEMTQSKRMIEQNLRVPVKYISYPVGGFNENTKRVAREAGYEAGFTTNRGRHRFHDDLYELKRIRIKDSDKGIVLFAKLSGFYNLFRSYTKPH